MPFQNYNSSHRHFVNIVNGLVYLLILVFMCVTTYTNAYIYNFCFSQKLCYINYSNLLFSPKVLFIKV